MSTNMKKLLLLWNFLTLIAFQVNSLDIQMDPAMTESESSFIYCHVGSVSAGITFYTEPANTKGSCFGSGTNCISTLYNVTQNTTGAKLEIASVDISRDEGVWYCQHDADISTNRITVNNYTVAGILLGQNWTVPPGPVDTFSAVMTLSCTNKVPNVSFTYEDSESNTGIVPTKAVSTTTKSLYDGITCENGNKFYEITLTASNSLDVFNNKQGVKFFFIYYGNNITAPFSVNYTAFSVPDCIFCLIIIIIALVLLVLLLIIYHLVIFFVKVSFLVMGILFFVNAFLAVVAVAIGIVVCVLYAEVVELILAIIAIVIGVLTNLYKLFFSRHVLKKADVPHRHLFCGFFAYPWKTGDASGDDPDAPTNTPATVETIGESSSGNSRGTRNQETVLLTNKTTNSQETDERKDGNKATPAEYGNMNMNIPALGLQSNQGKAQTGDGNGGQTGNETSKSEKGEKKKGSKKKKSKKKKEKQDGSQSPPAVSVSGVAVDDPKMVAEPEEQIRSDPNLTKVVG